MLKSTIVNRFVNTFLTSWIPPSIVACLIAILSLAPYNELNLLPSTSDLLKHFTAYTILGLLLFNPVKNRYKFLPSFLVMILVVIVCTIFGVLMELGQYLSPGRDPSYWDAKMNMWGSIFSQVIISAGLIVSWRKRFSV